MLSQYKRFNQKFANFARDAMFIVDGPDFPQCAYINNFSLCLAQGTVTQALTRNNPMILATHLVQTPTSVTYDPFYPSTKTGRDTWKLKFKWTVVLV